jgi:hypothetical protein
MNSEVARLKTEEEGLKICLTFQNHDNFRRIQLNTTETKMGFRFQTCAGN